jgi:PAS domain S-box-containing protein
VQIVAFRASPSRPMVVIVESAESRVLAGWVRGARWLAGIGAVTALVILALTVTAVRSLKAREAARRQRDAAQAQVALREREMSVIVKSVQELLFRTDAQGRLVFVNARWQVASDVPETAALGRPLSDLVRPESAAATATLFSLEGPVAVRTARVWLGRDDPPRCFDVAVAPLLGSEGIAGFAGSAVDVTEQQSAQASLKAQLAFTELLIEVLPLPLAILDNEDGYVSVNQAWEDFTGRPRHAVAGHGAGEDLPLTQADSPGTRDRELLHGGGRVRYTASTTHRDGSQRDIAITRAAVPGGDGRAAGTLVVLMDVSEFRQAERATREARDAAEEASRAKSEFVANISHELRTPLQSIIGFSELGQARSGAQLRLGTMFGDIHTAGQRMLALVNDLLDVAKIESTVGTFHLERTDVRALVRDVIGELEPLLAARRLRVDLRLSDVPLVAQVDPLRFQQVVRNVLANAIRVSPVGEWLAVAGEIGEDARIHITVRDRGPGIPPAELEQIFEAFVQSSKTKDGAGGTGLGLAICRKILQAHGGQIRAENNAAGGACFHVWLPGRGFSETTPGGL